MKYFLLLTLTVGFVASAQDSGRRFRANYASTPMPLGLGSSPFGQKPRLRSEVKGWNLTGSKPEAYEIRCDDVFSDCAIPILRTKLFADEPLGMGSLSHSESAAKWRGQRVELVAELKAGRIAGWAGLWMRIDGPDGQTLAFDNMQTRPLRGSSSFGWHSVVLNVPDNAQRISFGVMLHGPGAVFVRELHFRQATSDVQPTDLIADLRAKSEPASE